MPTLGLDFETYNELSLLDVGTSRYARHPSCENLMLAFALDDFKVEQWVPMEDGPAMPSDLDDMLRDPCVRKRAWNKPFEWSIFAHVLGVVIPHREWRDTMVLALANSMPGKLEKVGPILRIPANEQKDKNGKALIRTFCMPRKPTKNKPWARTMPHHEPEKWESFKLYNRQDVEAERTISDKLEPWDLPDHEWELWALDQEINQRGIPVNLTVVRQALEISEEITLRHMRELTRATGLENPNSRDQMLGWLRDHGYPFNDLKKGHVERALKEADDNVDVETKDVEVYKRVLSLRQETSKASIKKFEALDRAVDREDARLRNAFQFCAAGRTWRWGGRIYQPQNLIRPPKWMEAVDVQIEAVRDVERLNAQQMEVVWGASKVLEVVSVCVRPVIEAKRGCVFAKADLSAIENRVLGWMSGDRKILSVFAQNKDPYVDFGTYMYGQTYEELWHEYKVLKSGFKRQVCKPPVLGCGYMLSAGVFYEDPTTGEMIGTGLLGYAQNMKIDLTVEQAQLSVKTWRSTFEDAVNFWYDIERAAKNTIRTGREYEAGPVYFSLDGPFMLMNLPSGRSLKYVRPKLEWKMMSWGKKKEVITYEGLDEKGNWNRIQTHPGKLTENADQAIARDLLAHGMMLVEKEGLDTCMTCHDEIVGEVRERDGDKWAKIIEECMSENPKWAPDLPLAAKGGTSKYFIKD